MKSLEQYGWDTFFQPQQLKGDLLLGRITSIQGFKHYVITANGEKEAELSGKMLHVASTEELPKLGDWVTLKTYDTLGYIIDVLPRRNELARKTAGARTDRQLLAVNIDGAVIVQGLDRDFNLMRLDRYLVQLTACNITPIVVLNKVDLVEDWTKYSREIAKLQRDCVVYFCSTYTGVGLDELRNTALEKYKTYILIGSSGVGKSSLLNALMQTNLQEVNNTSDFNNKGKHTTTSRDLFQLPNGSLLIDTPGMREFGLTYEEGTSDDLFPAIQQFADRCRYSDCRHLQEAGCAVIEAVQSGALDNQVYESYLKLIREQRRFEMNAEDKKRYNKQSGKRSREANEYRNKYKY
ncbi:MAG: ribosome small subunit-dependent GTPase A [Bacteroidia bacterium]|nr:ribosome small subunit-dependent GTPase A [Bacteroidia bacterium]